MKNLLTIISAILCLCMIGFNTNAQSISWAKKYGGPKKDKGRDVGVDLYGNTYVTGFFTDSAVFGNTTLYASGNQIDEDIFIAKFDPEGNPVWAHSYGNGSNAHGDYPFGFSVNRDGWMVATGRCTGYLKFDNGDSIPSDGINNMFMSVYNSDGVLQWAKTGGALDETDVGTGGFIDNSGFIYCTGNFTGEGNIFGDVIWPDSTIQHHAFIICYDLLGNMQWVKVFSSETSIEARDITGDNSGFIYLGGNYSGTMDFESAKFTAKGADDGFLVKLTSGGSYVYAKTFGSSDSVSYESAYTLATDLKGNVYTATTFEKDIYFDDNYIYTGVEHNVALVAYDQNGNYKWSNIIKGSVDSSFFSVFCLGIVAESNVILGGCFHGIDTVGGTFVIKPKGNKEWVNDAFYAAFSSYTGEAMWAITAGGTNSDANYGLSGNNTGYAYATGSFRGNGSFGSFNFQSNGEADMFLLKMEEGIATSVGEQNSPALENSYPNPTNNLIQVSVPSYATELRLVDATGKEMLRMKVKGSTKEMLDLSSYANGLYFLQLHGENINYTCKVIKQ